MVEGARHFVAAFGERMAAERLLERSVFIRELLPQDLKLEIDQLTRADAMKAAHFLAAVVGQAHARQMDPPTRRKWRAEVGRNWSKSLRRSILAVVQHCSGLVASPRSGLSRTLPSRYALETRDVSAAPRTLKNANGRLRDILHGPCLASQGNDDEVVQVSELRAAVVFREYQLRALLPSARLSASRPSTVSAVEPAGERWKALADPERTFPVL